MKQSFFTNDQIATLVKKFGSKLHISVNRAGNIKVVNYDEPLNTSYHNKAVQRFWVLYFSVTGKYLWRRHDGTGYCYPLNMIGRKNDKTTKPFIWTDENGHTRKEYYRPYNIENSYFDTFDEAVEYFENYLKRYKGINI